MTKHRENLISLDIETSGPIPGEYSLLSIGACEVYNPENSFECLLKPINSNFDSKALEVTGLSLENLLEIGLEPREALVQLNDWLSTTNDTKSSPIFVGFNASFDWSFINYYFHRFLGKNPFGFTALDIKSLYMGATKCSWSDTRSSVIEKKLNPKSGSDHTALRDAKYQAELFRLIYK